MQVHLYRLTHRLTHHLTRSCMFTLLLAGLCIGLGSAGAQDAPQYDPFTTTNDINILRAEAARAGKVRVIVGLRADYTDADGINNMDSSSSDAVRRQISRSAQNAVLATLAASRADVQVIRQFPYIPYMALRVDAATLDALAANPLVISIENDALAAPDMQSSALVIGAAGVGGAWDLGYTGAGVTVAVLDTGVDKNHPALSGRVVSEACYNTNDTVGEEATGAVSRCPGGVESSTAANSGLDCVSAVAAGCEHGTHVAGTVASTNATNRGIAPDATLIAINVFSRFPSCNCVLAFSSDQIDGLNRVYALRETYTIAAVNMSLGGGNYADEATCDAANEARKAAIDLLRDEGIVTVISSGNSGTLNTMGAPACISTAVSVSATEDDDQVASFSNVANFLELFAPGENINSARAGTTGFQNYSGTSMAAPHVAGAWAVMRQAVPEGSIAEILNAFTSTGITVTDQRPGGSVVKPRLQLNDALLELLTLNPPLNLTALPVSQTQITISWDNVVGETGFTVESSPDGSAGWTQVGTTPANMTTFNHTGLTCSTEYFYRVISTNGAESSEPSGTVSAATEICTTDTELLVNGNFDDNNAPPAKLPDNWNGFGKLLGDKVRLDGAMMTSRSAPNVFQFVGKPGEKNSKIAQSVALLAHTFDAGDKLILSAYIDQRSGKPNAVIGQLVIMYHGGVPNTKVKLKLPAVKTTGYVQVSAQTITLTNTNIKKISTQLLYRAPTGKFYLDDVSLILSEPVTLGVMGGRDEIIPVPVPGDLRGG